MNHLHQLSQSLKINVLFLDKCSHSFPLENPCLSLISYPSRLATQPSEDQHMHLKESSQGGPVPEN